MKLKTKENTVRLSHKRGGGTLHHVAKESVRNRLSKKDDEKKHISAESNATDNVERAARTLSSETRYQINRVIKNKKQKNRVKKAERKLNSDIRNDALKQNASNSTSLSKISSIQKKQSTQAAKNTAINKVNNITTTEFGTRVQVVAKKAETMIISAFNSIKATVLSADKLAIAAAACSMLLVIVLIASIFGAGGNSNDEDPNFYNVEAYVTLNPYAQSNLYGQCTWFAWGRFYEIYGYSPGFTGDGWDCVDQLIAAHPDKWKESDKPMPNCVFSGIGNNHVGIITKVDGDILTVQEGNLDGITNNFQEATTDWQTITISLDELSKRNDGVKFAVLK